MMFGRIFIWLVTFLSFSAVYGVVTTPADFASYLLGIVIANLLTYTFFYIIMKVWHCKVTESHSLLLI